MPARGRSALRLSFGGLLLTALLHAWLHASVRPLLQVSDELSYLTAVQAQVIAQTSEPTLVGCTAPPDGHLLEVTPGGKGLFRHLGGRVLASLCEQGYASTAAFWLLRLVFGLSLPLLTLVTYCLARDIFPDDPQIPLGAAAVVALQPVAAGLAGAITPDSLANLFGGAALWLGTRQATGQARTWEVLAFAAATAGALASKDTAAFLAPAFILALMMRGWHASTAADWRRPRAGLVVAGAAALPVVAWLALRYATPTALTDPMVAVPPLASWPTLLRAAAGHVATQFPALVETAWLSIGNFGASPLMLPSAFRPLPWVAIGAVLFGALGLLSGPDVSPTARRAVRYWLVALAGCALQPGVREAVLQLPDVYQGRWLFPLLPALATLTMVGLTRLAGLQRQVLPLVVVTTAAAAAVALLTIASYHYREFPGTLDPTHLFLRSSSGVPLDPDRLALWVERPALLRAPGPFLVASLGWLAAIVIALAGSARPTLPSETLHD